VFATALWRTSAAIAGASERSIMPPNGYAYELVWYICKVHDGHGYGEREGKPINLIAARKVCTERTHSCQRASVISFLPFRLGKAKVHHMSGKRGREHSRN
jgi:hypothetical protein